MTNKQKRWYTQTWYKTQIVDITNHNDKTALVILTLAAVTDPPQAPQQAGPPPQP